MSKTLDDVQKGSEEQVQVSHLKAEVRKLKRALRKAQAGEGLLQRALDAIWSDPPNLTLPKPPKRSRKKDEEIAVLHVSDTHIGKITPSYDSTVARDRLGLLAQKVREITDTRRNSAAVNECRVYLGGDIIEGEEIFPHQAHEIEESVLEQAVKTGPSIIGALIFDLAEYFPTVKVCAVAGNHGSAGKRQSRKTNWDAVCYHVLNLMLRDRVELRIADTFYIVDDVFGWENLLVHGHEISGGYGGIPWYGAHRKAWGWIDAIPEEWQYLYLGHFHTHASGTANYRIWLANGTTESGNEYAQARLAATGVPCQRLAFYAPRHGLIADHQVFLAERNGGRDE